MSNKKIKVIKYYDPEHRSNIFRVVAFSSEIKRLMKKYFPLSHKTEVYEEGEWGEIWYLPEEEIEPNDLIPPLQEILFRK